MTKESYPKTTLTMVMISAALSMAGFAAADARGGPVSKDGAVYETHDDARLSGRLAAAAKSDDQSKADALVAEIIRAETSAPSTLQRLLANPAVLDPAVVAEVLWRIAQKDRLTDELATLAAELLEHDDPFVRALAEWAIAIKVGRENGGQQIVWPRADRPPWFRVWSRLDAEAMLEADYARLAVVWNIHHDSKRLLGSVGKIIQRAEGAASMVLPSASAASRAMVRRQLAALGSIRGELSHHVETAREDLTGPRRLWLEARRAARPIVLANPAVDFDQIVFVERHSAHSHRNITGSQYPWCHKPGGDICVKTGLEPGGSVRAVLDGRLGPGHVHGIDLWWNADRVVFGYAAQADWPPAEDTIHGNDVFRLRGEQEPTHLYEIRLDGTGLRQLTDHPYWNDFEPTYLADGRIAFASDRSGRSSECGKFSADHTVINLYAVSPGGTGLRRLNDNKDIDRYPHSLDNGLIAYTRWEYQERHFHEVHAIWQVRPDGTMADAVFNQHLKAPYGLRDARSIPGSPKLVSVATGHHTFAYGPVVIVDPALGANALESIRSVTPHAQPQEGPPPGGAVPEGGVPDLGGLYQTPWALSERCFLVSYSHARPPSSSGGGDNAAGFSIYLIDVFGNKELIHRDPILSCSFPMPLRRRPRPPVVSDVAGPRRPEATCLVADVYQGLEGIPRGTVRYLRISQRLGWPLDEKIGAMRWIPGNAWERHFGFWAWAPVRVIGEVPVENDGSAFFKVPVDAAVYFQALDANHMELRRMRSHVTFQPGESRGCVGCHETRPKTPSTSWRAPLAMMRDPTTPKPPPWGNARLLGYEWLIQPIFNRRCVGCHGPKDPAGGVDLSATRAEDGFLQSFRTLFGRRPASGEETPALVSVANRFDGAAVSRPKQFGSHKSRLVGLLLNDKLHVEEAPLGDDEWLALVTWIDANAPYHDTFYNRRPADGGQPKRNLRFEFPRPFAASSAAAADRTPFVLARPIPGESQSP
ncbi:MAG: HzsA-related protein [Planctomycetota bacterium]|jgi:hypothetical protein